MYAVVLGLLAASYCVACGAVHEECCLEVAGDSGGELSLSD